MKKIFFFALLSVCFLCSSVMAQDITTLDEEDQEEELNAFGFPDKSLVKIIENTDNEETTRHHPLPECDNDLLLEQTRKTVSQYINFEGNTILNRRRALLILKNVDNFVTLPQEEIGASRHSIVAARLIELKINDHVSKADIEVCQSDNPVLKSKLYLVMHPVDQGKTTVEILNFAKDLVPTFVFEQ